MIIIVPEDVIHKHISEYKFSGIIDNEAINHEIKATLLNKRKILKGLKVFIKHRTNLYILFMWSFKDNISRL
jgi:hypothetical protein